MIGQAKQANKGIRIDFSGLHPDVDKRQVVSALIDGMAPEDANKANAAAMGGHGVAVPPGTYNRATLPGGPSSDPMAGNIYQDYPMRRKLSQYLLRPAAEMIGQGIGGVTGAGVGALTSPITGAVGPAVGGFGGAVAGGTAADELMNKADVGMGLKHPETDLPDQTLPRLGREALVNTAMVGGGKIAGKAASELAAPFAESVNPEVQGAAKALNVPLTAAQQSNSKLLSQGEQMAAKLPGSAGILGDFYAKTRARMMDVANSLFGKQMNPQIAKTVGDGINQQLLQKTNELAQSGITPQLDPADVGTSIASDISDFTNKMMQKSKGAFNALKQGVPEGTTVPLTATAQQADKLLAEHSALPPSLQNPKLIQVLSDLKGQTDSGDLAQLTANASPDALARMKAVGIGPQDLTPSKSIPELMSLRSALGDAAAQHEGAYATNQPGTKFMGSPVAGAYKSLITSLDKDLGDFSTQTGGNFAQSYAKARGAHGEMLNTMENPYIKRVLSTDNPEKIVDMAVRPGDVQNLAKLQNMLQPETANQLSQTFTNSLIEKSQNADGQFIPQKLTQLIKQYGEPTIQQAVGPDGLMNLHKLSNLSDGSFTDPEFRQFISQIGRKNGENVSGFLLGASPQNINRVRSLIGEQSFGEAQDGMIHNLLTNNQDNVDFGGLAKRMSEIPPESLATAIPPNKLAILRQLSTVGGGIKASQREFSNPSGTAPMMGMFYIMRQLFMNPLNALKVVGGLEAATKGYTSPLATKYLTGGIASPATAEAIGSIAGKGPISVFGNSMSNPYKNKAKP